MGVAIVTAGPGVTDAVTGVANAWAANVPLLLIGGAAPTFNQGRGSLQEMPQTQLFQGITKWSDRVPSPELLPSYLAKAFRVARAGRPGPVFLEIPWDVLSNGADESLADSLTQLPHRRPVAGRPAQGRRRRSRCSPRAERPVILGGSSIWWDDAPTALDQLATPHRDPGLPERHGARLPAARPPLLLPAHPQGGARRGRRGAGGRHAARLPGGLRQPSPPSRRARRSSRWTSTPPRSGATGPSTWASWATHAACSTQLEAGAGRRPGRRGLAEAAARRARPRKLEKQAAFEESDQRPIHHFRLGKEIDAAARRAGDVTFVADGGNVVAVAAKSIQLPRPGRWLDPGPLGCLGVGAPFALAAKLLAPERPVLVIQGDGSFGLNGFDFETAVRFKLPMVVVVGNDAAWGQILIPQRGMYGEDKSPATRLAPTRYDRVVEAFGGQGEHVDDPADLPAGAGPRLRLRDRLLRGRRHRPRGRRGLGRRRLRRLNGEPMPAPHPKLHRDRTVILVVDVQDRLTPAMPPDTLRTAGEVRPRPHPLREDAGPAGALHRAVSEGAGAHRPRARRAAPLPAPREGALLLRRRPGLPAHARDHRAASRW